MSSFPIPNLVPLFKVMAVVICLMVPLAVWKLVDIGIWVFQHLTVTLK